MEARLKRSIQCRLRGFGLQPLYLVEPLYGSGVTGGAMYRFFLVRAWIILHLLAPLLASRLRKVPTQHGWTSAGNKACVSAVASVWQVPFRWERVTYRVCQTGDAPVYMVAAAGDQLLADRHGNVLFAAFEEARNLAATAAAVWSPRHEPADDCLVSRSNWSYYEGSERWSFGQGQHRFYLRRPVRRGGTYLNPETCAYVSFTSAEAADDFTAIVRSGPWASHQAMMGNEPQTCPWGDLTDNLTGRMVALERQFTYQPA